MSHRADPNRFAARLREIVADFRNSEKLIREEYARDPENPPPNEMTERATRRYLIDELLRALGWNPGDPEAMVEEARTRHSSSLFLDYLGVDPKSRAPAIIFEAKKFDVEPPRAPHTKVPNSYELPAVIADAIDALRNGDTASPLLAEWRDYLSSMHRYLVSMDRIGRANLKRAVISSGGWMVIFEDPCRTFLNDDLAEPELIHCFVGFNELLAGSDDIFDLLHRERLVDTLPQVLDVTEALEFISADRVERVFRGVLVVTSASSGARRGRYPTRAVYPALIVRRGSRWFAVTDLRSKHPVEEPRSEDGIGEFLDTLEREGARLEGQLAKLFGIRIQPSPLEAFPGFIQARRTADPLRGPLDAAPGSTADMAPARPAIREFITASDEDSREYVVVLGTQRFYKENLQRGRQCNFHFWKAARKEGMAEESCHDGFSTCSFTEDGQARHCAHAGMLSIRNKFCRIREIETHICCRACIFEHECWSKEDDYARMPCPQ